MGNNIRDLIPDGKAWARGVVSCIPVVGGALDHLVFDKADSIRMKNIEDAVKGMSDRLGAVPESSIDKAWFETEEALATFRLLADKAGFEPNKKKIEDLGKLAAACGLEPQSKDTKKLSVFEHLSRLSPEQLRLLKAVTQTAAATRTATTGAITQTLNAIWEDDVVKTLTTAPQFWTGNLNLPLELGVLESLNVVRQVFASGFNTPAYAVTPLGNHAVTYLTAAGI
jgi:hypothetical protein